MPGVQAYTQTCWSEGSQGGEEEEEGVAPAKVLSGIVPMGAVRVPLVAVVAWGGAWGCARAQPSRCRSRCCAVRRLASLEAP